MLRNVKKVTRRLHLHITLHLMAAAVNNFLLPQRNDYAPFDFHREETSRGSGDGTLFLARGQVQLTR